MIAILWDIARLLRAGNAIPYPFIVALFSAGIGAVLFNYGANFLLPDYIFETVDGTRYPVVDAIAKGSRYFIAGGVCFTIHALAVIKAYLL